jgi:hypothetical protein
MSTPVTPITPVSQPVVPAEPDLLAYGVQELALFVSYTRDSYLAAWGVQAPAWDPARVKKSWFDTTVDASNPANVAVYKIVGTEASGNYTIQQMVIGTVEASTVNLPGAIEYPPYVVAPTDATRNAQPLNPNYLSFESDAEALMALFGGTQIVDEATTTAVFPTVYPPDEPRRLWDVIYKGMPLNVGLLLLMEYANGIGAAGSWDVSGTSPASGGAPIWVAAPPAPTGLSDTRPARAMPVRDLLANEEYQMGLMGVSIIRTDLQQQANQLAGEFTPDDRATLQQIYQIVSELI